eukprot:m51a1_g807 hypothetical protein (91) ;mRNA; r:666390-666773
MPWDSAKSQHLEDEGKWYENAETAERVFELKSRLHAVDPARFTPVFQNCVALKMADLGHLFGLTSLDDTGGTGVLAFVDLCAGPAGGFIE